MNNEISFWDYLNTNRVEIPIVQRDYAQGRAGKETLRQSFLKNLRQALDNKLPDGEHFLKLDFIYGSKKGDAMQPLDGQQRLTTLWLLHWFIAYKAGALDSETRERLRKFTYETRISSRDFCELLATSYMDRNNTTLSDLRSLTKDSIKETEASETIEKLKKSKNFDKTKDILIRQNHVSAIIRSQTWFYTYWEQDPTIQSMLRMLSGSYSPDKKGIDIPDGLEEIFADCNDSDFKYYWERLTSNKDCPIVFYQLPMRDFDLSDDLYIKMNARGKQLTDFENFKADLIGYLHEKAQDAPKEWETLLDPESGIPIKMDTLWTDIFWSHKSPSGNIDDIYFAFLNRFFLNYHLKEVKDENDRYYCALTNKGNDKGDVNLKYTGTDTYKRIKKVENNDLAEIDRGLFESLMTVLDLYSKGHISDTDLTAPWDPDFRFIPEYVNGTASTINQLQRVVFYAICKYLIDGEPEQSRQSLRRWMRFVWNIASVRSSDGRYAIRSVEAIKSAVSVIDRFDSHNIYQSLAKCDVSNSPIHQTFREQVTEEIEKARQILENDHDGSGYWEKNIRKAESTAFFRGAIRFLYRSYDGNVDWSDFNRKFESSQQLFNENTDSIVLRNLIYRIGNWDHIKSIVLDSKSSSWMNILLDCDMAPYVHQLLTEQLLSEEQLAAAKSQFESSNHQKAHAHKDLFATRLTDNLKWENFMVDNGFPYRVVPPGKWAWYKICHIGHRRNEILEKAFSENRIKSNGHRMDSGFYKGDNINFEYISERHRGKYFFQWYAHSAKEYFDLYLMEISDNVWKYVKRNQSDLMNAYNDKANYFCDNLTSEDAFYDTLDAIIDEYIADRNAK